MFSKYKSDKWLVSKISKNIYVCVCLCLCVLLGQSCLILGNPMDCGPSGSSVHGILQARILEWIALSYSRGSSQPRDWTCVSCGFCIGRWILYHWATREVLPKQNDCLNFQALIFKFANRSSLENNEKNVLTFLYCSYHRSLIIFHCLPA